MTLPVLLKVQDLLHSYYHLVETVNGVVMAVAYKRSLLIFSDKTYTLLVELQNACLLAFLFLLLLDMLAGRKRTVAFPPSQHLTVELLTMQGFSTYFMPIFLLFHNYLIYNACKQSELSQSHNNIVFHILHIICSLLK